MGFVPELLQDLEDARYTNNFTANASSRIELRAKAVPSLGADVGGRAVQVVRAAAAAWPDVSEAEGLGLTELAKRINEVPERIAPVLLLLEWEDWIGSRTVQGPLREWRIAIGEKVLKAADVTTWDRYEEIMRPTGVDPRLLGIGGGGAAMKPFISFSHRDEKLGRRLRDAYLACGAEPFFASDLRQGIKPGEGWFERIRTALMDATGMVFVATRHSVEEDWSLFEMGAAIGRNVPAVTLLVGIDVGALPKPLQQIQAVPVRLEDRDVLHALEVAAGASDDLWEEEAAREAAVKLLRALRSSGGKRAGPAGRRARPRKP
ncbi:MAG: toll/interleukin-1 receptor domain-containing protein [Myxococcaceae bacterium]